ncbi:hypothetical protein GGX14DRAFT_457746 [Mycena pura]|uniref:F-box domain-containing protein n=1 Tax=Mycena pura TaxID=153505 RepID=A0AAD6VAR5_9AGAR|nr:hypothetical protein GGX14DRAFT_457746 [Mycena pura]
MTSPLAFTPGTEYSPSDEAVGHSPGSLLEPRLQLKHLDHEIAKLTEQRNKIALSIFPFRLLHRDVIQEIFIACLPADQNCAMSASEAPVLLGRVCSSWRTISLSTPRLWTQLHIVEPTRQLKVGPGPQKSLSIILQAKVEQRLQVIKTWLGRSGECPLSISFQGNQQSHRYLRFAEQSPEVNGTVRFLEAILPFAPRWQRISFTSELTPAMLQMLSKLTETDLPMLQGLSFCGVRLEHGEMSTFQWGQLRMIGAPCLTRFSLRNSKFVPDKLPVRWEQLTYLALGSTQSLPSDAILRTISKCPRLLSCHLTVNANAVAQTSVTQPAITIPSLQVFTLRFDHNASAINLLDHLTFPHLRSLSIFGSGEPIQQQSIQRFFAVSTQLERLHIHNQPFSSSSLCRILRSLPPTVQHLEFEDTALAQIFLLLETVPSLNEDVLAALLPDPASPYPCPALRTLIMDPCSISDEAVLHFLRARMAVEPRPSLKSVHIGFNRPPEADLRPQLQALIDAGLDLSITYLPPVSFSPWLGLPSDTQRLFNPTVKTFAAISPPPTSALSTYLEQLGRV